MDEVVSRYDELSLEVQEFQRKQEEMAMRFRNLEADKDERDQSLEALIEVVNAVRGEIQDLRALSGTLVEGQERMLKRIDELSRGQRNMEEEQRPHKRPHI